MDRALFVKRLFDEAKKAGFAEAEIYLASGDSFEATVHEGEILSYDASGSFGLGFRGLYQGKMGYASTQVLDEDAITQLVEGAKTNARLIGSQDPAILFEGSPDYPEVKGIDPALGAVSAADKLALALELEKTAISIDERVKSVSDCGVFTQAGETAIRNTLGLDVRFSDGGAGLFVAPIARDGELVNSSMKFYYGASLAGVDLGKLAREAVEEAVDGLGAKPVPAGDYKVAFRNDAAASLLGTFLSVFSADAAQKGLSLLKDREGDAIAAGCVTLIDDPLLPGGYSSAPFDAEGVASFQTVVVGQGTLNTLMHNLKTAQKQGVQTTGNAARGSYAAPVSVAPTNFYLKPGENTREALFSRMGQGVLITDVQGLHAGANAITGDFSLGAKGYLIEDGKLSRAVAGITVAGNFFSWLKNMELVADDLYFGFPGVSSVGSPTVCCGVMKIAG